MDYKFVQLCSIVMLIIGILASVGCINYLLEAWTGISIVQGSFLKTTFGIVGIILLISIILAFQKLQQSL